MSKVLKCIMGVIGLILLLVAGYFIFMTVTDYKPEEEIILNPNGKTEEKIAKGIVLKAMTFNIGYAGLDETMDFFMDGGVLSKARDKEQVQENMNGIIEYIKQQDVDFVLLQEVDYKAARSHGVDEMGMISEAFGDYSNVDAINYKVPWVPVPITDPMGAVKSGLKVLSKFEIESSKRLSLPIREKWPRQLALLDRCMIETRYSLENGKELVMVDTHMSAYDKSGEGKKAQMDFLQDYLKSEYEKGNYVVVGGDWNQELPGTDAEPYNVGIEKVDWITEMNGDFPNYKWGVDPKVPTSRNNDKAYKKGENYVAFIDGFLVSDNIKILSVKAGDLEFKNSDHNPVVLEFEILE